MRNRFHFAIHRHLLLIHKCLPFSHKRLLFFIISTYDTNVAGLSERGDIATDFVIAGVTLLRGPPGLEVIPTTEPVSHLATGVIVATAATHTGDGNRGRRSEYHLIVL